MIIYTSFFLQHGNNISYSRSSYALKMLIETLFPCYQKGELVQRCTHIFYVLKSKDITLPTKVCIAQSCGFSSSHAWMWELNHKQSWKLKNWCSWTVALEKTLESPLDSKEIQLVYPKGNQSWMFFGRTDAEAEVPTLSPRDGKN